MKQTLALLAKILVSCLLLGAAAFNADFGALSNAMQRVGLLRILAAALVLVAIAPLLALRWQSIVSAAGVAPPLRALTRIVVVGNFFNQVLPSAIGGDAIRIWMLRKHRVELPQAVSSIVVDRVVALLAMLLIGAGGASVWAGISGISALVITIALVIVFMASCRLLAGPTKVPATPGPKQWHGLAFLRTIATDVAALARKPLLVFRLMILSILIHAFVSMTFWMFGKSIGTSITLLQFFVCSAVAIIASILPIAIAGWGLRESAFVLVLAPLGVSTSEALALSVAFGIASLVAGLPGLLLWLVRDKDGSPAPLSSQAE